MSRFPWILLILLLVGTVVGAGWYFNNTPKGHGIQGKEDAQPPKVIALGFVDGDQGVAKLSPAQAGRVVDIIDEGKTVKKDDVLLRLDDRFARFKKDQAEADVNAAQEQL